MHILEGNDGGGGGDIFDKGVVGGDNDDDYIMAAINFLILEGEDVVVAASAVDDVEEGECVFEKGQAVCLCLSLCGRELSCLSDRKQTMGVCL